MTLAEIIKSDANALKLFSPQQINTLEASLITDEKNEKFYLNCLRRNKKNSSVLAQQNQPRRNNSPALHT